MKKVKIQIKGASIAFPPELLGLPNPHQSWIARADLAISPDDHLVISVFRQTFQFQGANIYAAENEAWKTFPKKVGAFDVCRMSGLKINHHIAQARNFIVANSLPTGEFIADVTKNEETEVILTMDLSSYPKDQDKIREVKTLLGVS